MRGSSGLVVCRLRVFAGFCHRVEGERGWYGSRSRVKASERTTTFFCSGVVSFVFFSGDLASLLQEFDWIGSSNRQQKIGSSPEKTRPLAEVAGNFRWNVLPRQAGQALFCLLAAQLAAAYQPIHPLISVAAGAGTRNKPTGLTGKLGEGWS